MSYPWVILVCMAAVLNFDCDEAPSRADADAAIATVLAHVASLPARLAVPLIGRYQSRLEAAEAIALATVVDTDGNTKVAENIAAKGAKKSRRARKQSANRAKAVKKNAAIGAKMATGELTGEHVDVLADAADKTGGDSLTNEALIADVAAVNPDLGKSVIDDHLLHKAGAAGAQTRHDRQRTKRRISRFRTKDDCEAIMIAGDKATIDRIWNQTTRLANTFYLNDGGRDLPNPNHPRTHDHRMFDAITTTLDQPDDTTGNTQQPATKDDGTNKDPDNTRDGTNKAGSGRRHTPRVTKTRPAIVVGVTLDKFLGLDPDAAAELIGSGPIADSVLAQYLGADPDIIGALYGHNGQLLWLGRHARLASQAQLLALITRDKHCVLCGANHTKCNAHHNPPWNAPTQGQTNITKLVLICPNCHHYIHDHQLTLYQHPKTRTWQTRPAHPHEIPPPKPAHGQAPQRK